MEKPTSILGFLDALKKWTDTVENGKPDRALPYSQTAKIFGKLLAENHEFQAIFKRNLDDCDCPNPEDAMNCVYAFLNSIAEAARPEAFRHLRWSM